METCVPIIFGIKKTSGNFYAEQVIFASKIFFINSNFCIFLANNERHDKMFLTKFFNLKKFYKNNLSSFHYILHLSQKSLKILLFKRDNAPGKI